MSRTEHRRPQPDRPSPLQDIKRGDTCWLNGIRLIVHRVQGNRVIMNIHKKEETYNE